MDRIDEDDGQHHHQRGSGDAGHQTQQVEPLVVFRRRLAAQPGAVTVAAEQRRQFGFLDLRRVVGDAGGGGGVAGGDVEHAGVLQGELADEEFAGGAVHAVDPEEGLAASGRRRRLARTDFCRDEGILAEGAIHLAAADAAEVVAGVGNRRFRQGQAAERAGHRDGAKKKASASLRTLRFAGSSYARANSPMGAEISRDFIML